LGTFRPNPAHILFSSFIFPLLFHYTHLLPEKLGSLEPFKRVWEDLNEEAE
jgi:hypothetical protein